MKKVITYPAELVVQIETLLNGIVSTGVQSAKNIAVIAQILDSGMLGEINEPEKKEGEG